jgi:hypothetical protein
VEPVNETRRLRGTLTSASEEDITLRISISPGQTTEIRLPLGSVQRANTVFSWGSAQKAPKTHGGPRKSAKGQGKILSEMGAESSTQAAGEAIC